MTLPLLQRLAPPAGTVLVSFLAFSSQALFYYIEPGPLRKGDVYFFNALVACVLICHYRTCSTDPGRIPENWHELQTREKDGSGNQQHLTHQRQRWCRKCEAYKPPRAHHCKTCSRCVAKMDHHCAWTANCVSHITLPHFVRFIFYAVASTVYLECLLYSRVALLWQKRHLPSYLGPNMFQLAHLFILVVVNSLLSLAMLLLLIRTLWSLSLNMTTIESWEVERHHALLKRARVLGGHLDNPDGSKIRIERQEFPWDIGIWANICEGMGSWNPLTWFWPFAKSPGIESGLAFEHNGIDDPTKPWPPPDPDRSFRANRTALAGDGFTHSMDIDAFRQRQAADLARHEDADGEYVIRRRPFHERLENMARLTAAKDYEDDDSETSDNEEGEGYEDEDEGSTKRKAVMPGDGGEEAWRNKEGERLADFGVDEVADFYDEDDVPLAELIRRRKVV